MIRALDIPHDAPAIPIYAKLFGPLAFLVMSALDFFIVGYDFKLVVGTSVVPVTAFVVVHHDAPFAGVVDDDAELDVEDADPDDAVDAVAD